MPRRKKEVEIEKKEPIKEVIKEVKKVVVKDEKVTVESLQGKIAKLKKVFFDEKLLIERREKDIDGRENSLKIAKEKIKEEKAQLSAERSKINVEIELSKALIERKLAEQRVLDDKKLEIKKDILLLKRGLESDKKTKVSIKKDKDSIDRQKLCIIDREKELDSKLASIVRKMNGNVSMRKKLDKYKEKLDNQASDNQKDAESNRVLLKKLKGGS